MALINTEIPTQGFELVRSRIAEILAEEIGNQFTITGNEDLDLTVWLERFVPLDKEELPAIVVSLATGTLDGHTAIHTGGTYLFNIDVYYKAKTTDDDDGDKLSTVKLHKTLGICRAILENPKYKTLGFAPPFIMNRHCEGMSIAMNPQQDAVNTSMGRLALSVKLSENVELIEADLIGALYTSVKLHESNQGYYYEYGATPTPPAAPTAKIFADATVVPSGTTVELGWIATGVTNVSITTLGQKAAIGYQDVVITADTTFIITATNAGGTVVDSITITIAAGCADANVLVKDSTGATLYDEDIPSNVSEDITITDSVITLRNSVPTTISTTNVKAQENVNIAAPDATAVIKNTLGTVIDTEAIPSNVSEDIEIPNVAWTQSNGVVQSTPYGGSIVCTPAPVMTVDFTADDVAVNIGEVITFTDATDNTPTKWAWDFDDSTISRLQNPTKFYKDVTGAKSITLLAANASLGGFKTRTNYITVSGDADAITFIQTANITDATQIRAINQLVLDLKSYGLWTTILKAIYPMIGGTANKHTFNLRDPLNATNYFQLQFFGGWTHSSNGVLPNGTNAYANTYFNPTTHASVNGFSFGIYSRTNDTTGTQVYGCYNGGIIFVQNNLTAANFGNGEAANVIGYVANPSTRFLMSRRSANNSHQAYRDGTSLGTNAVVEAALPNYDFYFGARNAVGVAQFFNVHQMAFAFLGLGMTDAQALNLRTAVDAFELTLGRNV